MTICPECNKEYERVASHWAHSACGYPEISLEQRTVLDGVVGTRRVDSRAARLAPSRDADCPQ